MTRNRAGAPDAPTQAREAGRHPVGLALTLLLIAPSAAVLTSRLYDLLALDRRGTTCPGTDAVWPVIHGGLPAIALIIALPAALLSLADRPRGWIWLGGALMLTLLVEVAVRVWAPGCV